MNRQTSGYNINHQETEKTAQDRYIRRLSYAVSRQFPTAMKDSAAMQRSDSSFQIVWRYFSWSNQTLAMIALWVATAYLLQKGKMKYGSLLTALPAAFMSAVSATYILMAEEGFRLSAAIACPIGAGFALVLLCAYVSVFLARVKTASRTENWRRS